MNAPIKRDHRGQEGFTLVELMIASGITLTAIVLAMGAIVSISTTTQGSADKATARMNLSSLMEEMRGMSFDEIADIDITAIGGLGTDETITFQAVKADGTLVALPLPEQEEVSDLPNPLEVRVQVAWEDGDRMYSNTATIYIRNGGDSD